MKTSSQWVNTQRIRADDALRKIRAHRKQKLSDIDGRARQIKAFADSLYTKSADSQQLDLLKPEEALSPELDKLLDAPLRGIE